MCNKLRSTLSNTTGEGVSNLLNRQFWVWQRASLTLCTLPVCSSDECLFAFSPFQTSKNQIKVDLVDENFTELKGEIAGPPDTPYEGDGLIWNCWPVTVTLFFKTTAPSSIWNKSGPNQTLSEQRHFLVHFCKWDFPLANASSAAFGLVVFRSLLFYYMQTCM